MTAPLTPRDNQPPDEPQHDRPGSDEPDNVWAAPAAHHGATAVDGGPGLVRELREAAVIALLVAACGLLLGVLWNWLAPHTPLISDTKAVYLKNTEGEEAIGADGTFVLLALGFGLLTAAVVFLFRRRGGIPLVVALTVGGLLGAVLGWQTGMWLGPATDVAVHARQVGPGVTFDGPLQLGAKGALLAWPIAAMLAQLALSGLFGPRDPEPAHPDWSGHYEREPESEQAPGQHDHERDHERGPGRHEQGPSGS